MSEKMVLDFNDPATQAAKPNAKEAFEKLGRLAVKMKEQDDRIMRMAQGFMVPETHLSVDTDAIRRSVAEYVPDPIIPEGYFEKTQEYQQKSLEVLESINENTANLYSLVELISRSNDKQDELIGLLAEVLSLAKAKDKAEADSMFKRILEKITTTTDSVESMKKIIGWATAVYDIVLPLLTK